MLNTYYENKWTYLPEMIEGRFEHGSVSMGNKMFVIGGIWRLSGEVFDSVSRKFTYIKDMLVNHFYEILFVRAVRIGHKIIVFPNRDPTCGKAYIYNIHKDDWLIRKTFLDDDKSVINCSKLPIV